MEESSDTKLMKRKARWCKTTPTSHSAIWNHVEANRISAGKGNRRRALVGVCLQLFLYFEWAMIREGVVIARDIRRPLRSNKERVCPRARVPRPPARHGLQGSPFRGQGPVRDPGAGHGHRARHGRRATLGLREDEEY